MNKYETNIGAVVASENNTINISASGFKQCDSKYCIEPVLNTVTYCSKCRKSRGEPGRNAFGLILFVGIITAFFTIFQLIKPSYPTKIPDWLFNFSQTTGISNLFMHYSVYVGGVIFLIFIVIATMVWNKVDKMQGIR